MTKQKALPLNTFTARTTVLQSMLDRLTAKNPKGGKDVLNMLGKGKGGESHKHALTAPINAKIDELCGDVATIFAADRNPKVTMRFVQFIGAVVTGNYAHVDRTSAKILYAMRLAGDKPLSTDALAYIVSGKLGTDKTSPETRGVPTRVVARLFGNVGMTTAPTQISRSVGDNGFMQLAGMTVAPAGKQNREYTLNLTHPLVVAFFTMVDGATESQLDAMTGEAGE